MRLSVYRRFSLRAAIAALFLSAVAWPALSATTYYSEDFEGYANGESLAGSQDQDWTLRLQSSVGQITAITGMYGRVRDVPAGQWAGYTCNDSDLASLQDYQVTFDIISYAGGRWIVGVRVSGSGGYFVQHIPGAELKVARTTSWNFLAGQTIIQDWDSVAPASASDAKIVVEGTTISLWIDSVKIGDVTDATLSAGTISITSFGGNGWTIDNIVVSDIASDGSPTLTHTPTWSPTWTPTFTATPTHTPTWTPTHTATPTVTPTSTPDRYRKIFIYDDGRREMKYDDARRLMIYDNERRILKRR